MNADVMYRNLPGFYTHRELTLNQEYGGEKEEENSRKFVDSMVLVSLNLVVITATNVQIWEYIAWAAVEYATNSDIQQLHHGNTSTRTSKTDLDHKTRLQTFFNGIPDDTAPKKGTDLAVQVLGSLNASLKASNKTIDILSIIPGFESRQSNFQKNV